MTKDVVIFKVKEDVVKLGVFEHVIRRVIPGSALDSKDVKEFVIQRICRDVVDDAELVEFSGGMEGYWTEVIDYVLDTADAPKLELVLHWEVERKLKQLKSEVAVLRATVRTNEQSIVALDTALDQAKAELAPYEAEVEAMRVNFIVPNFLKAVLNLFKVRRAYKMLDRA